VLVESGDYINMKVSVMKKPLTTHIWSWWGEIVGRNGQNKKKWQSSTLHVAPFEPQDTYLRRALEPDYRPVLNKEGHLRRFVLEQINGKKTVEEISCELTKHFPEEIPSLGEARTKVTRIIKKCSS
jgi:hypothetical protein